MLDLRLYILPHTIPLPPPQLLCYPLMHHVSLTTHPYGYLRSSAHYPSPSCSSSSLRSFHGFVYPRRDRCVLWNYRYVALRPQTRYLALLTWTYDVSPPIQSRVSSVSPFRPFRAIHPSQPLRLSATDMLFQSLFFCLAWSITIVHGQFGFFDQMFGGHQQQQQRPAGGMAQWQAHSDAGACEGIIILQTHWGWGLEDPLVWACDQRLAELKSPKIILKPRCIADACACGLTWFGPQCLVQTTFAQTLLSVLLSRLSAPVLMLKMSSVLFRTRRTMVPRRCCAYEGRMNARMYSGCRRGYEDLWHRSVLYLRCPALDEFFIFSLLSDTDVCCVSNLSTSFHPSRSSDVLSSNLHSKICSPFILRLDRGCLQTAPLGRASAATRVVTFPNSTHGTLRHQKYIIPPAARHDLQLMEAS